MEHGAASLHASVVPASKNATVMDQDRADRNAAFPKAGFRFFDCRVQELVDHRLRGYLTRRPVSVSDPIDT